MTHQEMTFTEFAEELASILDCDPNAEGILSAVEQREIEAAMLSNSIASLAHECGIEADTKTDLQNVSAIWDYIRSAEVDHANTCNAYHCANKNAADYKLDCITLKRALVILAKDID